jgi:SnoaL-like domain
VAAEHYFMQKDFEPGAVLKRLDILESKETLRTLVSRYAIAADHRNDPVMMSAIYTDDIVWSAEGFGTYRGKHEVTSYVAKLAQDSIVWTMHYMVSPTFTFNEDVTRAQCHWYLFEMAQIRTEGVPLSHWIAADYVAEAVRDGDDWRFCRVELRPKLISPYREGWEILPGAIKVSANDPA